MKRRAIAIVLLILTLLIGGNFYHINKIETKKQNVRENASISDYASGSLSIYTYISKTNENGDFLEKVRFHVSSFNDTISGSSSLNGGAYVVDEYESGYDYFEDAYNTLSYEQQQLVASIHTREDLLNLSSDYDVECGSVIEAVKAGETLSEDSLAVGGFSSCRLYLPTVFTIEETKAPAGYIKEKYYIPGFIEIRYDAEGYYPKERNSVEGEENLPEEKASATSNVMISSIRIETGNPQYLIRYGDVEINQLVGTKFNQVARVWRSKTIDLECGVSEIVDTYKSARGEEAIKPVGASNSIYEIFSPYYNGPYTCLVNHQGNIELEAKSYVNDSDSATIQVNQTLEYKVVVTNNGTGDAIDNVVRLTVPEGFVYIEGSATDNGFYHNGYVEWNVERIDVGKTRELSFKAYAPNGVPVGHEYVGSATIENSNLDTPIVSNQTMVRLSFQNPYTAAPIGLLIVIGIFIFCVVLCAIQRKQESK